MKKLFTFLVLTFFIHNAKAQNEFVVYGFYKMDDKYSVEKDSQMIRQWIHSKTETIIANNIEFNLFDKDRQGGGPNNAEWNSATDLYLAISLPGKINPEDLKILINGNQFIPRSPYLTQEKPDTVLWVTIPYEHWYKSLRKIKKQEYKEIYNEDFLDGISDRNMPSAPLNTGKIIKLNLNIEKSVSTHYFHVAYGE